MEISTEDAVHALIKKHPHLAAQLQAIVQNYTSGKPSDCPDDVFPFGTTEWWVYAGMTLVCVTMGALAAGLTMGMVGLDILALHITDESKPCECSTEEERIQLSKEKKWVKDLLPLKLRHHLLLVTLLLLNACANEAMPLFLDHLVPSWLSVIISVTFVLIFGEIIPSAIFTGPGQLRIAAFFSGFVWMLVVVLSPIAWPISKILDFLFGHEQVQGFTRSELMALTRLHAEAPAHNHDHERGHMRPPRLGGLNADEVRILQGVLDIEDVDVEHAMLPIEKVFSLDVEEMIDFEAMARIMASGYSRIPVYRSRKSNIVGLLLVKRLIVLDPSNPRRVGDFAHRKPHAIAKDMRLMDVMNMFLEGKSHVGIVTSNPDQVTKLMKEGTDLPEEIEEIGALGIVTLEDVLERLINRKISDETDIGLAQTTKRFFFQGKSTKSMETLNALELRRSLSSLGDAPRHPSHIGAKAFASQRWNFVRNLVVRGGVHSEKKEKKDLTRTSNEDVTATSSNLSEALLPEGFEQL